jgi:hypothetical protein
MCLFEVRHIGLVSFCLKILENIVHDMKVKFPSILISKKKKNLIKTPTHKMWSYGSWIYNFQCNQCLSPPMLWVRISIRARCTTLCDKVCHWLAGGRWFSPGPPLSSTNKTDRQDITEILLKVALNTITLTLSHTHTVRKPKSRCFTSLCTWLYCPTYSPLTPSVLIIFLFVIFFHSWLSTYLYMDNIENGFCLSQQHYTQLLNKTSIVILLSR